MRKHSMRIGKVGAFGALMFLLPGLAWAVGLGQIQTDTRIGQTLKARIPILSANANILQGLTVELAKPAVYKQAGLREADFLFNLKFQVKQGANGPYVLVTSTKPVRLPFLNLLVHAHWQSGDVNRQYTLLLNPPVFANHRSGGANVQTPSAPQRQTPIRRTPPEQPNAQPPVRQNRPASPPPARLGGQVEVRRGQTLWGIASRLGGNAGVGVNRMMIAIYHANPQAFSGNINRLKAGATLRVPSRADVGQVSGAAANAEVAQQAKSWKASKSGGAGSGNNAGGETQIAKTSPSSGSAAHGHTAGAGGEKTSRAVAANSPSASHRGELVLSAPKLSESNAGGASAPGVGANAATRGVATAAVSAGGAGGETAANGRPNGAAGTAASVGGPAKIRNGALANMAAAPQATRQRQIAANSRGVTPAATEASAAVAAVQGNQANPANQPGANGGAGNAGTPPDNAGSTPPAAGSTAWNWLTTPKGWIVIALIVLLLILIGFLASRRVRARHAATPLDEEAGVAAVAVPEADEAEGYAVEAEADGSEEAEIAAMPEDEETVRAQETATEDDAETANALAEAEMYTEHDNNAAAARVLRSALARAPERNDVRLRLLEVLFAEGDGESFRAEAVELQQRIPAESADWRAAAVMGDQLLPADPLFAEAADADEIAPGDVESLEFDRELERLTGEESAGDRQSDFDNTLGELSTMIETYLPEHGESPVKLHLPPEEAGSSESEGPTGAEDEEDVLEFEPDEDLVLPEEGEASNELPPEPAAGSTASESESRTQLDLAQAYLDMGDRDSARDVLKSFSEDDDGAHREEARRLLDELEGSSEPEPKPDYEAPEVAGSAPEAMSPEADESPAAEEESGTAIDLARAYLEMGDRESARDILEEVLDGDEESQRQKARELLETIDA